MSSLKCLTTSNLSGLPDTIFYSMLYEDFVFICNENTVDPSLAIEHSEVRKLLKSDRDRNTVEAQLKLNGILKTQF